MVNVLSHLAWIPTIVLLGTMIPHGIEEHAHSGLQTLFIIGFLGTWRYSWAAVNFTRAAIFSRTACPRRKARAFARFAAL